MERKEKNTKNFKACFTMCLLFPVSCLLLFFTSCLFAFFSEFFVISSEIKINELGKKQEICIKNIVDKTIAKQKKAKGKKTSNRKQIPVFIVLP